MNKELQELIQSDIKRVYDLPLSFKDRFFFPLQMKYLVLWRKAAYYRKKAVCWASCMPCVWKK